MAENPAIEFDYFLASELGLTVEELRSKLSNAEYVGWTVYYGRKAQREELAAKG